MIHLKSKKEVLGEELQLGVEASPVIERGLLRFITRLSPEIICTIGTFGELETVKDFNPMLHALRKLQSSTKIV
jgi:hypothetical protein